MAVRYWRVPWTSRDACSSILLQAYMLMAGINTLMLAPAGSDSDYDFEADWGAVKTGNAFEHIADAGTSSEEEEDGDDME